MSIRWCDVGSEFDLTDFHNRRVAADWVEEQESDSILPKMLRDEYIDIAWSCTNSPDKVIKIGSNGAMKIALRADGTIFVWDWTKDVSFTGYEDVPFVWFDANDSCRTFVYPDGSGYSSLSRSSSISFIGRYHSIAMKQYRNWKNVPHGLESVNTIYAIEGEVLFAVEGSRWRRIIAEFDGSIRGVEMGRFSDCKLRAVQSSSHTRGKFVVALTRDNDFVYSSHAPTYVRALSNVRDVRDFHLGRYCMILVDRLGVLHASVLMEDESESSESYSVGRLDGGFVSATGDNHIIFAIDGDNRRHTLRMRLSGRLGFDDNIYPSEVRFLRVCDSGTNNFWLSMEGRVHKTPTDPVDVPKEIAGVEL